jgi:hypothetical protein
LIADLIQKRMQKFETRTQSAEASGEHDWLRRPAASSSGFQSLRDRDDLVA